MSFDVSKNEGNLINYENVGSRRLFSIFNFRQIVSCKNLSNIEVLSEIPIYLNITRESH